MADGFFVIVTHLSSFLSLYCFLELRRLGIVKKFRRCALSTLVMANVLNKRKKSRYAKGHLSILVIPAHPGTF